MRISDWSSDVCSSDLKQGAEVALAAALAAIPADLAAGARLRRMKQVIALVTALADLAGEWPLEKVIATLSDFADEALDLAIATAIRERAPDAEPRGLALIGLGKHGSRELNYSSDVDPMLIYDPALLPLRPREEPGDAAVRIARRVIEAIGRAHV